MYKPLGHLWQYDYERRQSKCLTCGIIVTDHTYIEFPVSMKRVFRGDCPNLERKAFHVLMYAP